MTVSAMHYPGLSFPVKNTRKLEKSEYIIQITVNANFLILVIGMWLYIRVSLILENMPIMRASLIAQVVKNPPAMQETPVQFLGQEDPLEKGIGYPFQYSWAPLVSAGKESASNAGDGFYPWVGKILWRRERLPSPVFWP